MQMPSTSALFARVLLSMLGLLSAAFVQAAPVESAAVVAPAAAPAQPRLLIEGWLDRPWVSDIYVYDLKGVRQRRLTDVPLPTCVSQAVAPGGASVAFVANAGALHVLSVRHEVMSTLHAGQTGAVAFSHDGSAAAYVVPAAAEGGATEIHVKPVVAGSLIRATRAVVGGDARDLEFTADGSGVLYTTAVTRGAVATIQELDLATGKSRPLLADAGCSYWHPAFSPDGRRLLAIKEEPEKALYSLVAVSWPGRRVETLASFPRGREVTAFAFADGGKRIAFILDGVAGVMAADGTERKGLSGLLPTEPVAAEPAALRAMRDRAVPVKAPGRPLHAAGHYVSLLLPDAKGIGRVAVYDLATGGVLTVTIDNGSVQRAFLVD